MNTPSAITSPKGIGGWLALFAFLLCAGFARSLAEWAEVLPLYWAAFRNEAAHGPLVVVGLIALTGIAVQLWAIVALFRRKRAFKMVYALLCILTLAGPFSVLPLLVLPGVTLGVIFPDIEILRLIGSLIAMSLWYWYLCVSVRVKNTLVNE